ncbi:MAG: TlpA disulfide reductase family protein [Kiloniellaceae bacterium]
MGLTPSGVLAHGANHPADFRNGRNQFIHLRPSRAAPVTPFFAEDGSLLNLSGFRGKLVLLNLWATWCPPCIEELPALDRLQAVLAEQPFAVVALSIDEAGIDAPARFIERLGLTNLSVYNDYTGRAQKAFPLYGLPITYLIDRDGTVAGYIVGAADWDSPEAIEFLQHYLGS